LVTLFQVISPARLIHAMHWRHWSRPQGTERWTIHDLRRTMSTNMAMLGVPQPVTEALLNHKTGVVSGVAAVYNVYSYADEKGGVAKLVEI
jgi:integrase